MPTHPHHARLIDALRELLRQAEGGDFDLSLVPQRLLRRIDEHVEHRADLTVAALVSRSVSFYVGNVLNCEEVPPDLARMLLSGRPVEPVGEG